MTIKGLYRKVQAMDTDKIIDAAFDNTMEALADINRDRLLDGIKADGSEMPFYSERSVIQFGKEPGPIRLLDTGSFQEQITAKRNGNVISTTSLDSKTQMLIDEERYSPIFGTFGPYKKKYQDIDLRPALNKGVTKATGLKFK